MKYTQERRDKISKALTGRKLSTKHKRNMIRTHRKKKYTDEEMKKLELMFRWEDRLEKESRYFDDM